MRSLRGNSSKFLHCLQQLDNPNDRCYSPYTVELQEEVAPRTQNQRKRPISPEDSHSTISCAQTSRDQKNASTYPWFYLDSRFSDTVGYDWWFKHLKTLLKETESRHGVSQEVALSRMAAIQWLGYHSTSFKRPKRLFPSQKYSFFLAKEALKRGACLIVLWGNGNDDLWKEAVPGITKKRLGLNNKRTPTLTPGNLGRREFDMVVNLLGN